jgi:hypothetical protein
VRAERDANKRRAEDCPPYLCVCLLRVGRVTPVRAALCDSIATACPDPSGPALSFAFPFHGKARYFLVFTFMTLELGLVQFPL